jgi:hypothetical protein
MRVLSKEVFEPCRAGRPVFPGFVTYTSAAESVLLHRYGWVDASDTYDDFADHVSTDNGATWGRPTLRLHSHATATGRVRYTENAAFYDADRDLLLTFCSRALYPHNTLQYDTRFEVTWDAYDPRRQAWRGEEVIAHDLPGGLGISFCNPLKTRSGRLLLPAYSLLVDAQGRARHYGNLPTVLETALVLRGETGANGALRWECGEPVQVDPEKSSRGYSENALLELADGRLAMVLRGDNSAYPERPGYKWLCFSTDDGRHWSEPEPLGCTEGEPIESGSNGSVLLRSCRNGKAYWIGNLALDGERANANWPRSPLVIAEVQEAPFALRRETITVIDRRAPGEPPLTQMSNFRYYQDRLTGDVVLFLSRYGEHDPENWKQADYYRYRVSLE